MHDEQWNDDPPPPEGVVPPPAGSTIELVERSAERLVLFIPAGPRRGRELGCFAILLLVIISIITAAFANGVRQQGGPPLGTLFFLVPFWLVGLTMLYISLWMRHTRTLVLVEPGRAVLQQTFLGRTKTRETALTPGEPAFLVESYRQNDVPVDAVCLKGEPRPLKFATPLNDGEKSWIVDRINEFLGVQADDGDNPTSGLMPEVVMPETCTECGGPLEQGDSEEIICPACGHVNQGRTQLVRTGPSDTQPAAGEFPADRVTIVEQSPERLEFSMRVFENSKMRRGAGLVFGMVALFWNSFVATFVWATLFGAKFNPGSLIMLVFLLPFLGVGLGLAGVAAFILFGRLRVVLDRDALRASWGAGRLRYSKVFATEAITHVTVENSPLAVKNVSRGRSRPETDTRVALVWAGEKWIPVTMLQGVNDSRHVAELVRRQLADLGMRVEDRRAPPVVIVDEVDEDEDEEEDDELSDVEDETS